MKPLAILRDSLREAWDSKILLVMLVLSGLFLLGVASVSYKPGTAEVVFQDFGNQLSSRGAIQVNRGKLIVPSAEGPLAYFSVKDLQTVRAAGMPAASDHQFTVEIRDNDKVLNGFDKQVAAWHEDGSGLYAKVPEGGILQPVTIELGAMKITDEMVREYFVGSLDAFHQMPLIGFERLPDPGPPLGDPKLPDVGPKVRSYRLTAGPSAEPKEWPVTFGIGFGAYDSGSQVAPLGAILYLIQNIVINSVAGMAIIMLGVIVTSFFIPNMLRKGGIDLMLAKPISRVTLLLFKFLGGTFFVLILASVVVGGVWVITGLRAGVWSPGFLLVIPMLTFAFSALYALSTLMAVVTRSSIACILVTLGFGALLWLVGIVYGFAERSRTQAEARAEFKKIEPEISTWIRVTETLNVTLPRWRDIDVLAGKAVLDSQLSEKQRKVVEEMAMRKYPSWGGTIGVTLAWIGLFLGLACWRFSVKDY